MKRSPIEYTDPVPIDENIRLFKQALESISVTEAFLTTVAPASAAFAGVNEYYSSERDYIFALAEALREEYQRVHPQVIWVKFESLVEGAHLPRHYGIELYRIRKSINGAPNIRPFGSAGTSSNSPVTAASQ